LVGFNLDGTIKSLAPSGVDFVKNGKIISLPIPLDLSRKEIEELKSIIENFVFFKKFNNQLSGQISKYIKNYENLPDGTYIVVGGYGLSVYKKLGILRNEIIKKYRLFN